MNLIYGVALGYRSAIVPVYTLAAIVYFAFSLADLYGVALAALGMLSTLATGLTIDGYGPVTDNAGGIAEMAQLPAACREKTDCLDACVCGVPFSRRRRDMTHRHATPSTRRLLHWSITQVSEAARVPPAELRRLQRQGLDRGGGRRVT